MSERMNPVLAARLLRAKSAELESLVVGRKTLGEIDMLRADIALIAALLADHIESGHERQD